MDLGAELLRGAVVTVELAGLPPIIVGLDGPPSAITKALRPKVTLTHGGATLYTTAPHGDPRVGFPTAAVVLGGAALGLVLTGIIIRSAFA